MISPTARQACNVVVFGLPNRKCGTFAQHRAGIDRSAEHKYLQFPHFGPDLFVDMVGVTGSIPVAPTITPIPVDVLRGRSGPGSSISSARAASRGSSGVAHQGPM